MKKELILVHYIQVGQGRSKSEIDIIINNYINFVPKTQQKGTTTIYNYYLPTEFESRIEILNSIEDSPLEKWVELEDHGYKNDVSNILEKDKIDEQLNKTVDYSEYIADQLNRNINYCEYIAFKCGFENFDNFDKIEKVVNLEEDMSIKSDELLDDLIYVDESEFHLEKDWEIKTEEKIDDVTPNDTFIPEKNQYNFPTDQSQNQNGPIS